MIKSMTGYGSAESLTESYSLKVEIKSLNSKFLDLTLKLPKEFGDKELEVKSLIGSSLVRGKINFVLDFVPILTSQTAASVDEALFVHYFEKFKILAERTNSDSDELFKLALHAPNVIAPNENLGELVSWSDVLVVVNEAIDKCDDFRKTEGSQLKKSLLLNIKSIGSGLEQISTLDISRLDRVKARLQKSIEEIRDRVKVDQNRFEQELIYYLEKLDISEEKVRLKSHLEYFENVIDTAESNGKKLGFIAQEIGREINTIGSKANDAEMQRVVVGMKDELEQIKEQVLNVM